ncbi:MAG TPA: sensor histidine kinase [Candidatus Blautia pullicola]|uniref:histidine kinase n=1 Tax=Candidatus Blautia pullicola TaxID=2838498 RepID=A0A9D2FPD9_9FIRM|nr:sensor histidine kinase [Candidatus Blautia pullicola]
MKRQRKKFVSIRRRMMTIFAVLLTATGLGIAGLFVFVFRYGYASLSQVYLQDITRQTTNNLENNIQKIEDINLQILSSQVVQSQLRIVNSEILDTYNLSQCRQKIERELSTDALYASYVVSVSVISLEGIEFSVKKIETGGTQFGFTEDEIYQANGTSLWGLTGEKNRICVAKAVLDLDTMKPMGYINIVYENSYFADILEDNSTEYSAASYIVDSRGRINVTNNEKYLGTSFPMDMEALRISDKSRYDMLSSTQAFYYVGDKMPNGWTLVQTVSVEEFYKNLNHQILMAVIVVLTVLGISVLFVWIATSRIAKPTRELMDSMKTLGKENKYPRVHVVSQDEIGMIGTEYNKMAENIETLIEKVYKMELTQKQAELEFLQMQINPHFLYNALDTISWMALGKGNGEISEMSIALAELLRATIKNESFIPLQEEMTTVKDYLFIQEQRFGDKISVSYQVEERASRCQVPNFILQPLIENAIIHGLEPKIGNGSLSVKISIREKRLFFVIEDDGVGMTEEEIRKLYESCKAEDTKQSIGLKNVYRRLLLCYGEESRLNIQSKQNEGTKIYFSIPLQERKTDGKLQGEDVHGGVI